MQASPSGLDFSLLIPPDPLKTALVAAVVPGVVACAVLGFVWWSRPKSDGQPEHEGRQRWLVPVSIAAVAVFAEIMIRGWPSMLWPPQVPQRFVLLAVGLGLAGLTQSLIRRRMLAQIVGALIVVLTLTGMFIEPALKPGHAKLVSGLVHSGVVLIAIACIPTALSSAHNKVRGWTVIAATLPALALAGPTLVLANTAPAAQLSTLLPAVLSAAMLVALVRPSLTLGRGGWTVLIGWHLALILYNTFWGWRGLGPITAGLMVIAPLGGILPAMPGVRRWPSALRVLLGGGVSGGLALAALAITYRAATAAGADAYY